MQKRAIDGRQPQVGALKLETYTCNLDSGLEAFLQPSDDNKEELSLRLGGNDQNYCVSLPEGW